MFNKSNLGLLGAVAMVVGFVAQIASSFVDCKKQEIAIDEAVQKKMDEELPARVQEELAKQMQKQLPYHPED